jgi:hypothetical protein
VPAIVCPFDFNNNEVGVFINAEKVNAPITISPIAILFGDNL